MRLFLVALTAGLTLVTTEALAEVTPSGPPLLTIQVAESVDVVPDVATISTGVQVRAPTASEAMAKNAAQMDRLIAAIKAAGIAPRDIQTSAISLSAQYGEGPKARDGSSGPPQFIGYDASNTLTVRSRDIARLGPLLDRFVAAGATNIDGPTLSIDKPEPLADQARVKAMATGKARAELYAHAAGYAHVRLVSVNENGGGVIVEGNRTMRAGFMSPAPTSVEAGEVSTRVSVTMTFAMEN